MNDIYEKIAEWLLNCEDIGSYVYFNVIPLDAGSASINSNSSSVTINTYNDGSKEVRLLFYVNIVKEYDEAGTSDLNFEAMSIFDKIIKYVEDQNESGSYPELGDNITVSDIGCVYKAPEVYVTDDNPNIARYEGQFYIEYLERK